MVRQNDSRIYELFPGAAKLLCANYPSSHPSFKAIIVFQQLCKRDGLLQPWRWVSIPLHMQR